MTLPLERQLCFAVYATSMAINRTYKPMLDAMGLTYPQYLVLCALNEAEDLTVGALAARLGLESSTITPLVKRIERAGLVARRRDESDERQVRVSLTDSGRALVDEAACLGDRLVERSGMTVEQVDGLNEQVKALRIALEK